MNRVDMHVAERTGYTNPSPDLCAGILDDRRVPEWVKGLDRFGHGGISLGDV